MTQDPITFAAESVRVPQLRIFAVSAIIQRKAGESLEARQLTSTWRQSRSLTMTGFVFDWEVEALKTFVATANSRDPADAPQWIQTPPPNITTDTFIDELVDELELVAGGRCGHVLLAPNTPSQALSIALMLGRIESERFMQDVAQAAFNGVEQVLATTYNLAATEAQESEQNNFPKPRNGHRLFQ